MGRPSSPGTRQLQLFLTGGGTIGIDSGDIVGMDYWVSLRGMPGGRYNGPGLICPAEMGFLHTFFNGGGPPFAESSDRLVRVAMAEIDFVGERGWARAAPAGRREVLVASFCVEERPSCWGLDGSCFRGSGVCGDTECQVFSPVATGRGGVSDREVGRLGASVGWNLLCASAPNLMWVPLIVALVVYEVVFFAMGGGHYSPVFQRFLQDKWASSALKYLWRADIHVQFYLMMFVIGNNVEAR